MGGKDAPLFHWHPFLMTLSFVFLLPGGLSYLQPRLSAISSLGLKIGYIAKVRFHWIAMTFAALLGTCGVAVIYYNKILNDKPHFTSWHGLVGIVTIALFASQALGGIFVLYPATVLGFISKSDIKKFHI